MSVKPVCLPPVCLTIGDSTGIGPEIMVKFLQHAALQPNPVPLCIIGDIPSLNQAAAQLQSSLPQASWLQYVNIQDEASSKLPGKIAFEALEAAISKIHAGEGSILVTGPISKENLQAAGLSYSGHTEILQALARQYYKHPYQSDMLFLYRGFRMLLLTRHVPLRKVSESLSIRGVSQSLENLIVFLKEHCRLKSPRLCILGVNPHAGELDGDEEERVLKPALKPLAEKHQLELPTPIAADAAFRNFKVHEPPYDAYVAAYHDQGLIPFKMVAGLSAVNVTIGLPFLRTSVSHGTAPDIVGQGIADPSSLIEAYNTAWHLLQNSMAMPVVEPLIRSNPSNPARV